jgi:DNA-binding IscR family transcriptional regulator
VRFQVLTAASMKITVFWDVAIALMMEAANTSEKSVNFYQITWRNNPEYSHLNQMYSVLKKKSVVFNRI